MMDIEPFYLEQYKMLRDEITFTMGQIYSTETYGAIAVAGVYAWLLLNAARISIRAVWFIPPLLIFVCAIHCLVLALRLSMIGGYLRSIEEVVLGMNGPIGGWEHYKLSHRWVETSDFVLASVAWTLATTAAIGISWLGFRMKLAQLSR
jgi:hypothetical protein